MYPILSNSTSHGGTIKVHDFDCLIPTAKIKKKRNLPGNPDPDAEVIALSPKSLMTTNRFVCEICNKGFQRDQNLQLHRRGHNLPWKLKQRNSNEIVKKRAYVCPEPSCVHHHPSRALGDLTGIKKHFCRKHGEKKWKCDKCSKIYAVQSDWKAHNKTCGTREYRCDCGTLFSRKDSFVTHRAFCDALAEESARQMLSSAAANNNNPWKINPSPTQNNPDPTHILQAHVKTEPLHHMRSNSPPIIFSNSTTTTTSTGTDACMIASSCGFPTNQLHSASSPHLSATALLQKAAIIGATSSSSSFDTGYGAAEYMMGGFGSVGLMKWQQQPKNMNNDHSFTRDFLGLKNGPDECNGVVVRDPVLNYTGGVGFDDTCRERANHSLMTPRRFGFAEPAAASEPWGLDC